MGKLRDDRGSDIDFDLVTLRLFESAVRLGSISAAANEQHIAISAVSRRLSDLEHRLGTAVLYRKGRGVETTPAGETLLAHATNLIRLAERANDEMSDFAVGHKGHVRLAANPSAIAQFLPDVFSNFQKENPDVKIELREETSGVIVRNVTDGIVDIGVFSRTVAHDGIETFPYLSDRLCVVTPEGHPLASSGKVRFQDILDYPHVALEDASSIFAQFEETAAELDRSINVSVRVRSFDGVRRMTASGIGVGILPAGVAEPYAESDQIAVVDLDEPWAERGFLIGIRERRALSRPAEKFLSHMLANVD